MKHIEVLYLVLYCGGLNKNILYRSLKFLNTVGTVLGNYGTFRWCGLAGGCMALPVNFESLEPHLTMI